VKLLLNFAYILNMITYITFNVIKTNIKEMGNEDEWDSSCG
jgi:hypothetical protein